MKRYSIMARPSGQSAEVELCQCDTHPEAIVEGAQQKKIKMDTGKRKVMISKYEHVYFIDNHSNEVRP
jgi:hypothetical protein